MDIRRRSSVALEGVDVDRELIIRLAREAGVKPLLYDGKWAVENLDVFAALVAAHERTAPTPRQWVSLTEQEMYDLFFHDQYGPRLPEYLVNTIKCIEAALKEKNSGS